MMRVDIFQPPDWFYIYYYKRRPLRLWRSRSGSILFISRVYFFSRVRSIHCRHVLLERGNRVGGESRGIRDFSVHGGIEYKGCVGVALLILPVTLFLKGCRGSITRLWWKRKWLNGESACSNKKKKNKITSSYQLNYDENKDVSCHDKISISK